MPCQTALSSITPSMVRSMFLVSSAVTRAPAKGVADSWPLATPNAPVPLTSWVPAGLKS